MEEGPSIKYFFMSLGIPAHENVNRTLLFFFLDAGLLARSQYSEGPATGHVSTGFSWFPCA